MQGLAWSRLTNLLGKRPETGEQPKTQMTACMQRHTCTPNEHTQTLAQMHAQKRKTRYHTAPCTNAHTSTNAHTNAHIAQMHTQAQNAITPHLECCLQGTWHSAHRVRHAPLNHRRDYGWDNSTAYRRITGRHTQVCLGLRKEK